VVALYLGNDLRDYCTLAQTPYWQQRLSAAGLDPEACPVETAPLHPALRSAAHMAMSSAVLSAIDELLVKNITLRAALRDPQRGIVVRYGEHSTVLSRGYLSRHAANTDLERPEVGEGWRILLWSLEQMARLAGDRTDFMVLLVPSKESVLYESVPAEHPLQPLLTQSVMSEREVTRRLTAILAERGIWTAYPFHCMQHALQEGPLFPANDDGHPLARGYARYADSVVEQLGGKRRTGLGHGSLGDGNGSGRAIRDARPDRCRRFADRRSRAVGGGEADILARADLPRAEASRRAGRAPAPDRLRPPRGRGSAVREGEADRQLDPPWHEGPARVSRLEGVA
jgi:hypothetical protein